MPTQPPKTVPKTINNDEFFNAPDELSDAQLKELATEKKTVRTKVTKFKNAVTSITKIPNETITKEEVIHWETRLNYISEHLPDDKEDLYQHAINTIIYWFESQAPPADDEDEENTTDDESTNKENKSSPSKKTHPKILYTTNPFIVNSAQQPLPPPPQSNIQQSLASGSPQYQHPFVYTKITTDVKPFDGCPLKYGHFIKLFELKYENNPNISPLDRFLKFVELVGHHGEHFTQNIFPDDAGLAEAKRRMADHFANQTTIRVEAQEKIEKLKPVINKRNINHLRENLETCETVMTSLKNCGVTTSVLNHSYYSLLVSKFPFDVIESFTGSSHGSNDVTSLLSHIRKKMDCCAMTAADMGLSSTNRSNSRINSVGSPPQSNNNMRNQNQQQSFQQHQSGRRSCSICDQSHKSIFCNYMDATRRKELVNQKKLCPLCIRPGHGVNVCTSPYRCPCGARHSKTICPTNGVPIGTPRIPLNNNSSSGSRLNQQPNGHQPNYVSQNSSSASDNQTSSFNQISIENVSSETTSVHQISSQTSTVPDNGKTFSQTVLVTVNGQQVRMLLDSGADRTLITESLAKKLNLPEYGQTDRNFICAYNQQRKCNRRCIAIVQSLDKSFSMEMIMYVLPMSSQSKPVLNTEQHANLKRLGYPISDVTSLETESFPIELIVGIDYYQSLWKGDAIQLENGLFVQKTNFGWILAGLTNCPDPMKHFHPLPFNKDPPRSYYMMLHTSEATELESQFLKDFSATKLKHENNQYTVELPWLQPVRLGNNQQATLSRFQYLIIQLKRKGLFEEYSREMDTIIRSFAEPAPEKSTPGRTNRMPHHPVINRKKTTSQVRPVFDGGCAVGKQRSLNDNVYKGINSWDSLELLLKFRFGSIAITADIEKAYLMIKIANQDRDALRFYWLNENGETTEYRFTVVPFGTSASPFLLFAVMKSHFHKYRDQYPDLIPLIENSFYVDDLLVALPKSSTPTIEKFHDSLIDLMKHAGMNIRKFRTNLLSLDQQWAPGASESTSVLGHLWNVTNDTVSLSFDSDNSFSPQSMTKRLFSSFMASIYDRTGLTTPFLVTLRFFLRKLWSLKYEWDLPLSPDLNEEAMNLVRDARLVTEVSVPRNVIPNDENGDLLVYCDANHQVIGIAAYCLTSTSCHLIKAKAKLVPNGTSLNPESPNESINGSIPEKELNALLMAAQCVTKLKKVHNFSSVTILSDSLINLQRLDKHPNTMKPSVALKISQLKSLTDIRIRHIESKLNIADLITKGSTMSQLINNQEWWTGPRIPAETLYSVINVINETPPDPCREYSSYEKALRSYRVIAQWTKSKNINKFVDISVEELALIYLIKTTQAEHFADEIQSLNANQQINRFSLLRNYSCFIDDHGILRLRTRLEKAINLTQDQKCPILMPGECCISALIIEYEHRRLNHSGVDRTLASVRERFFIIHAHRMAKTIRRKCHTCKLIRANTNQPNFGPLPNFRLTDSEPPFAHTGLDIFGPLKVCFSTRGKRYGIIYTCATTRAVHLELLLDMTSKEVFQSMRRFFARRGIPQLFYSDNGTQFLAIRRRFIQFLNEIQAARPEMNIKLEWKLQTAISPWRGGFFERLIRSVKEALTTLTMKKVVTDQEVVTCLYEIESRINSRPLFTYKGKIFTPSHFFRGRPITSIPSIGNNLAREITRTDIIDHYLKSIRCQNAVWTAWKQKYLLELRLFHENKLKQNNATQHQFKVGDVVILKNNTHLSDWPLGIVEDVYPYSDQTTRTVLVRTTDRSHIELKDRAVQTLIPLECSTEQVQLTDAIPPSP